MCAQVQVALTSVMPAAGCTHVFEVPRTQHASRASDGEVQGAAGVEEAVVGGEDGVDLGGGDADFL